MGVIDDVALLGTVEGNSRSLVAVVSSIEGLVPLGTAWVVNFVDFEDLGAFWTRNG